MRDRLIWKGYYPGSTVLPSVSACRAPRACMGRTEPHSVPISFRAPADVCRRGRQRLAESSARPIIYPDSKDASESIHAIRSEARRVTRTMQDILICCIRRVKTHNIGNRQTILISSNKFYGVASAYFALNKNGKIESGLDRFAGIVL